LAALRYDINLCDNLCHLRLKNLSAFRRMDVSSENNIPIAPVLHDGGLT